MAAKITPEKVGGFAKKVGSFTLLRLCRYEYLFNFVQQKKRRTTFFCPDAVRRPQPQPGKVETAECQVKVFRLPTLGTKITKFYGAEKLLF